MEQCSKCFTINLCLLSRTFGRSLIPLFVFLHLNEGNLYSNLILLLFMKCIFCQVNRKAKKKNKCLNIFKTCVFLWCGAIFTKEMIIHNWKKCFLIQVTMTPIIKPMKGQEWCPDIHCKIIQGVIVKEGLILGALLGLSNSVAIAKFSLDCDIFASACFLISQESNPHGLSKSIFHLSSQYSLLH
jgi:hypothetical protein